MSRNQAMLFAIGLAFVLFSVPALAGGFDYMSTLMNGTDVSADTSSGDGILRLTPDKNELIRLNQNAASVIVNNPVHAEVLLDSPRLLIIMPRKPGTTSFTVLNARGETILQKNIIVTSVQSNYVRIRRICAGGDDTCVPAAYYYCPDGCYEVTPVVRTKGAPPPPPTGGRGTRITAASVENPTKSAVPVSSDNKPVSTK
ncbi:MAG: pilus assembly protein N-terminal domain-containing protein [Alphaproteobacteria bacterium]|nr:pilus assembly protein N-terminal domain-containing protein [Alphaproteobacteria bacterium]